MGTQLYLLVVLVCLMNNASAQRSINETAMTRPGCPYRCEGDDTNVTIPYPFGIGPYCARDENFIITCNITTNKTGSNVTRPFNRALGAQVLSIYLDDTKINVEIPPVKLNVTISEYQYSNSYSGTTVASIELDWTTRALCILVDDTPRGRTDSCSPDSYCYAYHYGLTSHLDCRCKEGFQGNPYLLHGCQDIDECEDPFLNKCAMGCENFLGGFRCFCDHGYQLSTNNYTCQLLYDNHPKKYNTRPVIIGTTTSFGTLFLLLATWFVVKVVRKRNKKKLKQKFFKRNGGFLLEKQLNSGEEGNIEKTKLFTSKELEKATDHYNTNRILGQGGQGTVYKGMLNDGRIVAVKKSTKVDEGQLDQFINEVVILSHIVHRNVVKLHGCCLETEVPLLVYEFIPNGTLFHYIHDENEEFPLTWDVRLRIATEVAAALSYLHYSALFPIYHRDIKSTNILLDDKYRAKVADFGTSRSIAVDQTHLTTKVLGTFGYLDPEYLQSGQFTEKSDVYSFGVVLVELLTSQQPISSTVDVRSLATHFKLAMGEDRVYDIINERMRKENRKEEIIRVANLASRCLNLKGRKRPTMKEVAMELEAIRTSNGTSTIQQHYEEVEYDTSEFPRSWETSSASTSTVCLDIQPLLIE